MMPNLSSLLAAKVVVIFTTMCGAGDDKVGIIATTSRQNWHRGDTQVSKMSLTHITKLWMRRKAT